MANTMKYWYTKVSRGQVFVARRQMSVGGRTFAAGERFDNSLVTDRTLRLLYEQRKIIRVDDPEEDAVVVDPPAPEPEPEEPEYSISHRGGGNWYLMKGDEKIDGPFTKDEAQEALDEATS